MRNLRLLATVIFVAVLLVGVVFLLRQTSTQNDTSVTSVQPVSEQQLAANRVATDPPVKKIRKIAPSAIQVGAKKVSPLRRTNSATEQSKANQVELTGATAPFSSKSNSVASEPLPPSKAKKSTDNGVGKVDMSQASGSDIKSAKKEVVRKVLEKRLNTNNNNQ